MIVTKTSIVSGKTRTRQLPINDNDISKLSLMQLIFWLYGTTPSEYQKVFTGGCFEVI